MVDRMDTSIDLAVGLPSTITPQQALLAQPVHPYALSLHFVTYLRYDCPCLDNYLPQLIFA
jgi:hypothetical protein